MYVADFNCIELINSMGNDGCKLTKISTQPLWNQSLYQFNLGTGTKLHVEFKAFSGSYWDPTTSRVCPYIVSIQVFVEVARKNRFLRVALNADECVSPRIASIW